MSKKLLLKLILLPAILVLFVFLFSKGADAAGYGWITPSYTTNNYGCGMGSGGLYKSPVTIVLRNYNGGGAISGFIEAAVPGWGNSSTNSSSLYIGCVDVLVGYYVHASVGGFHEAWTATGGYAPASTHAHKNITDRFYLLPTSFGPSIAIQAPSEGGWINYDPDWLVYVVPSPGHSSIGTIGLFAWNSTTGSTPCNLCIRSGTFGAGTHNLGKFGLPDGWYAFGARSRDNIAGGTTGVTVWSQGREYFGGTNFGYFGIDRAAPINVTISRVPSGTVYSTSTVTFTGKAQDSLSGLDWIQVWVRRTLPTVGPWYTTTCQFNGEKTLRSCLRSNDGPWAAGTRIEYFARGRDLAGNQADSVHGFFNVVAATGVIQGRFWKDDDGDGVRDWNDINGNGKQDSGEAFTEELIRNNPAMACSGFVNSDARVSISGPPPDEYPNLCNPDPYYSTGWIPIGTYTVSAIPPAGWEVTSSNPQSCTLTSGSHCDRWFGMRPGPPPSACEITVVLSPSGIEQGQSTTATVTVRLTSESYTGLTIDLIHNNNDTDVGNDLTSDSINLSLDPTSVDVTQLSNGLSTLDVGTASTTPPGTYTIVVTGHGGGSEGGSIDCSGTAALVVSVPTHLPWLKTEKGDVGSIGTIGPINRNIIAIGEFNADYLIISQSATPIDTDFISREGWRISNYGGLTIDPDPSPNIYDAFKTKFGSQCMGTLSGSPDPQDVKNAIINSGCRFLEYTGTLVLNKSDWESVGYDGPAVVIFVSNQLKIKKEDIVINSADSGIIFVVRNSVRIEDEVSRADGIFITAGDFISTDTDIDVDPPTCASANVSNQLTIHGAVYVFGNPCFNRNLGPANASTSAEHIIYEPKYLWLLRDIIGESTTVFTEVAP